MKIAIIKWALLNFVLTALIFAGAGTFHYLEGLVFLGVMSLAYGAVEVSNFVLDPELFASRVAMGPVAERERSQKIIQGLIFSLFAMVIVVSTLDWRFGWSQWSPIQVAIGYVLIALGFFLRIRVFRANTFASASIECRPGQVVVDSGPYSTVRHPMYLSVLLILGGTPLALGSRIGEIPVIFILVAIAWRIIDEERFLRVNLPGYSIYLEEVKYRLLPSIW